MSDTYVIADPHLRREGEDLSTMNQFLEDLVGEVLVNDYDLGYCGHDLGGDGARNIIRFVIHRAADEVLQRLGGPHSTGMYHAEAVEAMIRELAE